MTTCLQKNMEVFPCRNIRELGEYIVWSHIIRTIEEKDFENFGCMVDEIVEGRFCDEGYIANRDLMNEPAFESFWIAETVVDDWGGGVNNDYENVRSIHR